MDWVPEGLAMDKDYTEIHCDMPGVWGQDCQEAKSLDHLDAETWLGSGVSTIWEADKA